ncbi:MAG: hypothetical protein KJ954_14265 [Alphaproteobacteria bacterium]|nr:hypothetical protein [Alphaproteobacteria bacterium]
MGLANDSILVTPGSGATVATHLVGGKEHQVVVLCDESGHIQGSLPTYYYATPAAAVGASKLYLDIFNATGSGKLIDIRGIWIIPKTDVAVVGALGIRVDLYRTSAVGTGGTAWNYKSATIDVAGGSVWPCDTANAAIPAQITARHLPTAGATISGWIFPTYALGEEAATSQAYMTQYQNILPILLWGQKFAVREGEGILLKQGAVAATGNIGFLIAFTLE